MVVFNRSSLRRQNSATVCASPPMSRRYNVPSSYPKTPQQQWMPNDQQSVRQSSKALSGFKVGLAVLFLVMPWAPYMTVRMSFHSAERNTLTLFQERLNAAGAISSMKDDTRRLEEEEKAMHEETGVLFSSLIAIGPLADSEEYEEAEKLEEILLGQIDNLHKFIQSKSRITVLNRYGRGPQKIAFDLDLPNEFRSTFVVQLTDSRLMPHSSQLFLDMVAEQLWEGQTMVHRGDLTVRAPSKSFEERIKSKKLLFTENSEEASRGKHSICFSGVGPSFYISLEDRPINKSDTCFGAVVENNSLLGRIPDSTRILKMRLMDEE